MESPPSAPSESRDFDMRPLKRTAMRLWPAGHPLREAILDEPDSLPRDLGLAKCEAYVAWAATLSPR